MSFLIYFIVLLVILLITYSVKKPRNFPPGPYWLPVIGCQYYMQTVSKTMRGGQHMLLEKLNKQWNTNVLGLKLGHQIIVSVSSYPTIKKVFACGAFDARPNNFFGKLRTIGTAPGITCAEGKFWADQKKIITRHLRNLGLGKSIMEANIKIEINDIVHLIDDNDRKVPIGKLLQTAIINLIWSLLAGNRLSRDDPKFIKLIHLLDKRGDAFDMAGGTLSHYPWLSFIVPEKVGYNLIKRMNSKLKEFFLETINEHHKTWSLGNNTDLIYSFISEMDSQDPKARSFTNDQLLMVCLDLFVAGAHSTGGTLDFAFLMMLLHPEVQIKVQNVLDKEFSDGHSFTFIDRHKVPYIEAVLSEVTRLYHVLPIAGSRRALRDVKIDGYIIPKDSTILINLYSVFMSKDIWGDPENFRPERFLNEQEKLRIYDEFVPFSTGRRRCLGEPLARYAIFIIFAEIMKRYNILPVEGQPLPTSTPRTGITSLPEPYFARFAHRRLKHGNHE